LRPRPPKPAPKPEEELPDAREDGQTAQRDHPSVPTVVVQEPKNPVLTERAVNTQKGLTSIAVKRYISEVDKAMNRFTLPLFGQSVQARAMAMYAEDGSTAEHGRSEGRGHGSRHVGQGVGDPTFSARRIRPTCAAAISGGVAADQSENGLK
jgi:hypothetical protein